MRRSRLQATVERLETREHASHPQNGVASFARPAAMRGAPARLERDPLKAFVRDRDVETGRLGDDGRVGAPVGDERVGANAGVLFVDDRRHDDATLCEAAALGDAAARRRSSPRRRPSCPARRGRRDGRRESPASKGDACRSRRRCRCGRRTSASGPARGRRARRRRWGGPARRQRSRRGARWTRARPQSAARRRPRRARPATSDGFTESIATRSRSSAIAGSANTVIRGIIDA